MYMLRQVWNSARGKGSETLEAVKIINGVYASGGNTSGKIYVDYAGRMDTVVWEVEVESLDEFFTGQRGFYATIGPEAAQ